MYKQEPPNAVQLELSEGCNLRCTFCGLNGIRGKENNFKFLHPHDATHLAMQMKDLGWNSRIEMAMHGEPTMNPDRNVIVYRLRQVLPKHHLMMTSNGGGLLKGDPAENIINLLMSGLNVLALDDYQSVKIVPKIREALAKSDKWKKMVANGVIKVAEYPADKDASPHARRHHSEHWLIFIEDISKAQKGNHSNLNNHAGAGAPKDDSAAGKRCAKPFREMSVRWDGNVAVCCNDWRGEFKCGNVFKDGLDKVWNGAAMQAARKYLYHGMRTIAPCEGCNALSYRVGLLPDKLGKASLPKPGPKDAEVARQATAGEPYTQRVVRPWEK